MAARSEDQGPCKRGCCWTPLDICAKQNECEHHENATQSSVEQEIADFARQLNLSDFGGNAKWTH